MMEWGEQLLRAAAWLVENWFYINIILAIVIVFFQRDAPQTVWAWLLLLYFIPILGFLLYLVLHQDMHKRKLFQVKEIGDELNAAIRKIDEEEEKEKYWIHERELQEFNQLVRYNLTVGNSVYTEDNSVEIITDGVDKFSRLLDEIDRAQEYIHLQYYIIQRDELFETIQEHLEAKAREGVEVRILYDSMGCRSMRKRDWQKLRQKGIRTGDFFPASLKWLHVRVNYRNHRKIVVIDGRVGFVGGYNIGREYISMEKRFGYWRDTHLILQGSSVLSLGLRFALDWNYATDENLFLQKKYFECSEANERMEENKGVQIIASGPDTTEEQIRNTYLFLIYRAKRSIRIQTPYFIPDQAMMTALQTAAKSGVDVRLMIPCKPDHPFVYWATYSYMGELLKAGARCYTYEDGFLHAKGLVIDGRVLCYGTANMDIRSFKLNFEVNAVVYDAKTAQEMEVIFDQDCLRCKELTWYLYSQRNLSIRAREQLFRLLSPIL